MSHDSLRIFTGNSNPGLANSISKELGLGLGSMVVSRFSDGEIRVKVDESARGMDVFLIQSTCSPVNENIMELLIMVDAFRRASASRITCVMPYYGYARQDKKVKPREPVTARLVADLVTTAGASRILSLDLHAEQIQGFFAVPVDHLLAAPIIAQHLISRGLGDANTVVVSPDVGGVARAQALAHMLGTPLAIIAKRRTEPNKSEVVEIIGNVEGKIAVMIDDMIDTGGSISQGATELEKRGAVKIYACCTHPVLSGDAMQRLMDAPIQEVVVTDTIPLHHSKQNGKITVLSVASLLADAISRIHRDQSVSDLFKEYA